MPKVYVVIKMNDDEITEWFVGSLSFSCGVIGFYSEQNIPVRLAVSTKATCNLSPYNVKLPRHYRIIYVAPQKSIYMRTTEYVLCFFWHQNIFSSHLHLERNQKAIFSFTGEISNICTDRILIQHFKKRGLPSFLTTKSHSRTNIYIINLDMVSDKHVYLLKIKLRIQQMQSQDLKKS